MRGSSSERTRHCSMANPARMAYTTWRKRAVQGMTILPSAEHAALRDGHPRAPQETIPRVSGAHLRAAMTERLGRVPPRAMTWHDLYLPTRTSACKHVVRRAETRVRTREVCQHPGAVAPCGSKAPVGKQISLAIHCIAVLVARERCGAR